MSMIYKVGPVVGYRQGPRCSVVRPNFFFFHFLNFGLISSQTHQLTPNKYHKSSTTTVIFTIYAVTLSSGANTTAQLFRPGLKQECTSSPGSWTHIALAPTMAPLPHLHTSSHCNKKYAPLYVVVRPSLRAIEGQWRTTQITRVSL